MVRNSEDHDAISVCAVYERKRESVDEDPARIEALRRSRQWEGQGANCGFFDRCGKPAP